MATIYELMAFTNRTQATAFDKGEVTGGMKEVIDTLFAKVREVLADAGLDPVELRRNRVLYLICVNKIESQKRSETGPRS